jgi:hypothetical protein
MGKNKTEEKEEKMERWNNGIVMEKKIKKQS